jgi:hypothetical protein
MIRYRLTLAPDVRYSFHIGAAPLTKATLEQLIEGAIVHAIDGGTPGYAATVDLRLDADPNDQILNTIIVAIERCGYSILEGEISQWVDAEAQGALMGFMTGAGCGAFTKDDGITIISAILGALLGHQAGAAVRKHEVIYKIARAYRGAPLELVPVNDARAPTIAPSDWLTLVRS